jgi:hypothetical protein
VSLIAALGALSMLFVVAFTWQACAGPESGHGQSRRESMIEAWTNIAIGFSLNWTANLFLLPMMTEGGHLTLVNNWWGGWVFTAISMLRQFVIRRWFNSRGFAAWLTRRLRPRRAE